MTHDCVSSSSWNFGFNLTLLLVAKWMGFIIKGILRVAILLFTSFWSKMLQCSSSKAKGGQGLSDTNSATYLTQVSCVVYTHIHVYSTRYSWLTPLHSASEAPGESRGLQSLRCDQIVPRKDSSSAKCCREAEELWKTQVWLTARCWNLKKEKGKKHD